LLYGLKLGFDQKLGPILSEFYDDFLRLSPKKETMGFSNMNISLQHIRVHKRLIEVSGLIHGEGGVAV